MPDKERMWRKLKNELKTKHPALTEVDLEYIYKKFNEIHKEDKVGESELINEFNDFAAQTARILIRKPSPAYDPTRNNSINGEQKVKHERKGKN